MHSTKLINANSVKQDLNKLRKQIIILNDFKDIEKIDYVKKKKLIYSP